jgi:hypothetical protein
VTQLSDQQVLLLDLLLERQRPLQLLLCGVELLRHRCRYVDGFLVLKPNGLELRLGALDEFAEFFFPRYPQSELSLDFGPLTVLDVPQCALQTIYSLGVAVSVRSCPVVGLSHCSQLVLQLGCLLA